MASDDREQGRTGPRREPGERSGSEEDEGERAFADVEREVEATELWEQRIAEVEEQVRRRREGHLPGDQPDAEPDQTIAWNPPPEASPRARARKVWVRIGWFVLALAAAYGAIRLVTGWLFVPRLEVVGVGAPEGRVEPGATVRLGLRVRNHSFEEGAAFAVLVRRGGADVEGQVVDVAARDTAVVPVEASFPPGDHVISLVLFDAWKENVRVDARSGILVRVGTSRVNLLSGSVAATRPGGDSLRVRVTAVNGGERGESLAPLVVIRPAPEGAPVEVSGPVFSIARGDTVNLRFDVRVAGLEPGPHVAAVVPLSAQGERLGEGVYGIAVRIDE